MQVEKNEIIKTRGTEHKRATDLSPEERRTVHKRKKRTNRLLLYIVILCVLLLLLVSLLLVLSNGTSVAENISYHASFLTENSDLLGKWDMDGVTAYEFLNKKSGKLILPSSDYEFTYQTKGDLLIIDFANESAKDASYQFSVQKDTLTLVGGTETTQNTYTLTRIG